MWSRVSTLLLALSFLTTELLATPTSATPHITPRQGWLGPYPTASKCTCFSKEGKTRLELLCEGLYGLADYGRVEKGWNVVSHGPFQLLPLSPSKLTTPPPSPHSATSTAPTPEKKPQPNSRTKSARPPSERASRASASTSPTRRGWRATRRRSPWIRRRVAGS